MADYTGFCNAAVTVTETVTAAFMYAVQQARRPTVGVKGFG